MAQAEISPTIKIKPVNVDAYVKALCAVTGEPEPPVGTVTNPQMNKLIRALMNFTVAQRKRETLEVADLE